MFKRLFFSIDIPDTAKEKIILYKKNLEKSLSRGVKWVRDENLHITVLFLGQIKESLVDKLLENIESVKEKPFEVTIGNVSYFPKEKTNAKLIWADIESLGIKRLEKRIKGVLSSEFKVKTNLTFIPHITLGRIKQWEFQKMPLYEIPDIDDDLSLNFKVTTFNIIESKTKKEGPSYHILKSFNLVNENK